MNKRKKKNMNTLTQEKRKQNEMNAATKRAIRKKNDGPENTKQTKNKKGRKKKWDRQIQDWMMEGRKQTNAASLFFFPFLSPSERSLRWLRHLVENDAKGGEEHRRQEHHRRSGAPGGDGGGRSIEVVLVRRGIHWRFGTATTSRRRGRRGRRRAGSSAIAVTVRSRVCGVLVDSDGESPVRRNASR
jgi:hypothetical protein